MATSTKRSASRSSNTLQAAPRESRFGRAWIGVVAIVVMTIVAYLPAFRAGYVWDDSDHVTQAEMQRTVTALKWVWTRPGATPQYYPLTHTTFWIEYRLWGMNPVGYHAVNVILHAVNSLLLWRVLTRLGVRGAWLAAAIFAIHPIHVESVAWITERKNTLSGFFYLLAMLAGLRAWGLDDIQAPTEKSKIGNQTHWPAYILCLLCFFAAILSKTVTCTLPAVLVLLLWWKRKWKMEFRPFPGWVARSCSVILRYSEGSTRIGKPARSFGVPQDDLPESLQHRENSLKRDALMLLPMFAMAIIVAKITSGMESSNVGAFGPEFQFSPADRALIAGRAIWFYAGKLVWPARLAFIYPRWNIDPHAVWQWIFPMGVVVAIGLLWLLRKRIGKAPIVAVLFFVGTLFPALGFVNVYPMRFSFVADHFQYLASIGLIAFAANLLSKLQISACADLEDSSVPPAPSPAETGFDKRKPPARAPAALKILKLDADPTWSAPLNLGSAVLLLVLGFLTFRQTLAYRDAPTLWRDTLAKNPDCWLAMDNLGADAEERGDMPAALQWYDRSLATNPKQREAHWARGRIYARDQRWDAAAAEFTAAASIRPDDTGVADHEMARLLVARGDLAGGATEYEKVLAEAPTLEPARFEYATLLRRMNRPQDAKRQYQIALDLNPDSVGALSGLAGFAFRAGDISEALRLMSQAIDIDPADAKLCNNYGVFLMQAGRAAEAGEQFSNAIAADPNFPEAYDGLGNALQAQGNLSDAAKMYRKSLQLRPDFQQARQHLESLQGK